MKQSKAKWNYVGIVYICDALYDIYAKQRKNGVFKYKKVRLYGRAIREYEDWRKNIEQNENNP